MNNANNHQNTDPNCVFCRMINGEITPAVVYQDEHVYAFLDNNPTSKGHTLVIPKIHTSDIFTIEDEQAGLLMKGAKKVALILEKALGADGMTVRINNRPAGGQEIMHLHMHLLPRFKDTQLVFGQHVTYEEGEKEKIHQLIQNVSL